VGRSFGSSDNYPGCCEVQLTAWLPGAMVQDNLCGPSLSKLSLVPILPLNEICMDQYEGDGVSVSSPHMGPSGLELVPFEEGEPLPLNWS
jgi:hypothetical protein